MNTWKLEIEYDGTRYRGWQERHNERTIRGELMNAARQLFASKVEIAGAEGTDAGVHALKQIAHLKASELQEDVTPRMLMQGFNDVLPYDINILKVRNAPENFHARKHVIAKQYLYKISTRRTAFDKNFVWWVKKELNTRKMQGAVKMLDGRHNFSSFCDIDDTAGKNSTVKVEHAEIFLDNDLICFRMMADRFLWSMVRRIVAMLVEVGKGKFNDTNFQRLLKFPAKTPPEFVAPSSGLFLEKIYYKS